MAIPVRALVALVALALCASGCGSSRSGRARPTLSDAVEEAQKPPEEQEPVRPKKKKRKRTEDTSDETDTFFVDDEDDEVIVPAPPVVGPVDPARAADHGRRSDEGLRVGVFTGVGSLTPEAWTSYRTVGAFFGAQRRGGSAVVRGAVSLPHVDDNSAFGTAVSSDFGMYIEGYGILNLMPEHTLMDLGPAGVLRFGFLDWTYANPITYMDGDSSEEIDGDTVGYMTLMVGAAITPLRSRHFSVGTALLAGGQLYSTNTLQGFENDVFDAAWIFELTVDLAYRRVGGPL